MAEQLPPFTAPGAAKQYWQVLARAVTTAGPDAPADDPHAGPPDDEALDFDVAVDLILAIAGSAEARRAVASALPDVDADEKLAHVVAWLLQGRRDVLEAAIRKTLGEETSREAPPRARALTVLLHALRLHDH